MERMISMYGAILGDIIGSPFEFDRGDKTKDFKLFTKEFGFTDDTVLTIAVAQALIKVGLNATKTEINEEVVVHIRDWGKKKELRVQRLQQVVYF